MKDRTTIPLKHRALSFGALAPGAGTPHGRETITYNAGAEGKPYHADRRKVRVLPGGLLSDGTIIGTERGDFCPGFVATVVFGKAPRRRRGERLAVVFGKKGAARDRLGFLGVALADSTPNPDGTHTVLVAVGARQART